MLKHTSNTKLNHLFDNKIFKMSIVFLFSLFLLIITEYFFRLNFNDVKEWLLSDVNILCLNILIIMSFLLILIGIFRCYYIAFFFTGIFFFAIAIINYLKMKFRAEPFFPWDIFISSEALNVADDFLTKKTYIFIGLLFAFLFILIILKFILPPIKSKGKNRAIIFIVGLFIFLNLIFQNGLMFRLDLYEKAGISICTWNQIESYDQNGVLLSVSVNLENLVIKKPLGYNEQNVLKIKKNIKATNNSAKYKPNIIIIMNESFWDPTLLPEVEFDKDPMSNLRQLAKSAVSGYIVCPMFGGGTANTEFEVLTGNSTAFLPEGTMAYQQYIKSPTVSLASILRNSGYFTSAIHSYEGWFWDRKDVYKRLGFNEFISVEYFKDISNKGGFVSDEVITDMILDKINNTDEPSFIYAVTMQNHGPYYKGRYEDKDINIISGLDGDLKEIVETYAQGVYDADKALYRLTEALKESEEPSIVVFFGDHLPALSGNYEVYKKTGFLSENATLDERLKMKKTPFIIWSNTENKKLIFEELSSSFLGSYILDYSKISKPEYFSFLKDLSKEYPVISNDYSVNSDGEIFGEYNPKLLELKNNFEILQYDRLFGNQYLEQDLVNPIVIFDNSDYNKDINDIQITNTEYKDNKLFIYGENMVPAMNLFINGKITNYEYIDSTKISIEKMSINEIKIILNNSKGEILTQSNIYTIK